MRGHFFAVAAIAFTALNLSGCGDSPSPTPSPPPPPTPLSELNIVEALQAGDGITGFVDFVSYLTDANLVDLLSGPGPWTVLAFSGDESHPVQNLPDPFYPDGPWTGDALADLMKYHVVSGNTSFSQLTDGESLGTLFGPNHSIIATVTPSCIGLCWTFTSESQNTSTTPLRSIECNNGVIWAVGAMLIPNGLPPNTAQATADVSDLVTQMAI